MNIVLGVTSSIAIYKSCEIVRELIKKGYNVQVIMTKNATKLVSPKTFSALTQKEVLTELFSKSSVMIDHISLAQGSSCLLVAPATANIIGKFSSGIADDFLSTYYLSHRGKVLIAPAMNSYMWENPSVKENIEILKKRGNTIIEPISGKLACGEEGIGKMAEVEDIVEATISEVYEPKYFKGKRVIVTAGPTREYLDPVRFISNPSSGKMGYSIAKVAKYMGAEVTLFSGKVPIKPPYGIKTIYFNTSEELFKLLKNNTKDRDFLFMCAAVGDFKVPYSNKKIKRKEKINLELEPNIDIIKEIKKLNPKLYVLAFGAEEENLEKRGQEKLKEKKVDSIFVNDLKTAFEGEENEGFFITKNLIKKIEKKEKEKVAEEILLEIAKIEKLA